MTFTEMKEHDHPPLENKMDMLALRNKLRKAVMEADSSLTLREIFEEVVKDREDANQLDYASFKNMLYRARKNVITEHQ